MANPLTWQQVAAPNFAGSNLLYESASKQIGSSFDNLATALGKYHEGLQGDAGSQLLANAAQHTDLASLQGAAKDGSLTKGVDLSMVPMDAWKALDAHATSMTSSQKTDVERRFADATFDSRAAQEAAKPAFIGSETRHNLSSAASLDEATKYALMTEGERKAALIAGTEATQAGTAKTLYDTDYLRKTEDSRKASVDAVTAVNTANAADITQKVKQGALTFDQGQATLTGFSTAANSVDLPTAITTAMNDPKTPDAVKPMVVELLRKSAGIFGVGAGTGGEAAPAPGTGVGGALAAAAAPGGIVEPVTNNPTSPKASAALAAAGGDWRKLVTLGTDSSGKVSIDSITPETTDALARFTQLYGPVTINSSTGGVHTPGGEHPKHDALDLSTSGKSQAEVAEMIMTARRAGFSGFGIGGTHLHLDMRNGVGGDPFVFGDAYNGPIDGANVNGWQGRLNNIQPVSDDPATKLHQGLRRSLSNSAEAATSAQAQLDQSLAGDSGLITGAMHNNNYNMNQAVTDLKGMTTETTNADGVKTSVKGTGPYSDFTNVELTNKLNEIRAMAAKKGTPINIATAKELLISHSSGRWAPASASLGVPPALVLDSDEIDKQLDRMRSDAKDGYDALGKSNAQTSALLAAVSDAQKQAVQSHNAYQTAYNLQQSGRKIPQSQLDRLQNTAQRYQDIFNEATRKLGDRKPTLQHFQPPQAADADPRARWQAAQSLGMGVIPIPNTYSSAPASVTGRLSAALQ